MKIDKFLVKTVLLRYWDPVGVGDNQNLQDEYDGYVDEIIDLLSDENNVTIEVIFRLLTSIELREFGEFDDPMRIQRAANALIKILPNTS